LADLIPQPKGQNTTIYISQIAKNACPTYSEGEDDGSVNLCYTLQSSWISEIYIKKGLSYIENNELIKKAICSLHKSVRNHHTAASDCFEFDDAFTSSYH
jgi:hypothetical protein